MHAGFGGLDRVPLVVDRRSRAGEVIDLVDLDVERERHVVADKLEARFLEQFVYVAPVAGVEIVRGEHVVAQLKQASAQVRADETRAAGDQSPFAIHEAVIYQPGFRAIRRS